MFSREDHLKTLSSAAVKFGDYKVKIVKKYSDNDVLDEFDRDVEELKNMFGSNRVIVVDEKK